jgi:hypothetical protein
MQFAETLSQAIAACNFRSFKPPAINIGMTRIAEEARKILRLFLCWLSDPSLELYIEGEKNDRLTAPNLRAWPAIISSFDRA